MSLLEKIEADTIAAMKAKDLAQVQVLRLVKNALKNSAIASGGELTDEAAVAVLKKQAKDRQESIDLYTKLGKTEAATQEQSELDIIKSYLPAEASDTELLPIIQEIIASIPNASQGDFGKIMGQVMAKLKGKADASRIAGLVKQQLHE